MEQSNLPESTTPELPMSTLALVSLISGILGILFIPVIGGIVAIVTGTMAQKETRAFPPTRSGDGMATAGMVLGWLGLVVWVIVCCLAISAGVLFWSGQSFR